jgi:hypothetical protein
MRYKKGLGSACLSSPPFLTRDAPRFTSYLERAMGFEPHSVAGSALKPASRLLLGDQPPRMLPSKGAHPFRNPLSWVQTHGNAATYLERAMGFEPTTTSLGS